MIGMDSILGLWNSTRLLSHCQVILPSLFCPVPVESVAAPRMSSRAWIADVVLYDLQPPQPGPFSNAATLGQQVLLSRGLFDRGYWYWLGVGVLLGYSILFNLLYCFFLKVLNRKLSTVTFMNSWKLFGTGVNASVSNERDRDYWCIRGLIPMQLWVNQTPRCRKKRWTRRKPTKLEISLSMDLRVHVLQLLLRMSAMIYQMVMIIKSYLHRMIVLCIMFSWMHGVEILKYRMLLLKFE